MVCRAIIVALALSLASGCAHPKPKASAPVIQQVIAPYQQFIEKNFDWSTIQRIVLMLPANQTAYPRLNDELQANLAAELQRAGRFEVVVATRDDPGARAQDVFTNGQFNEMEVLRVAREYQADAVLFVNMTQYHPYPPLRLGLSLLLISPAEGIPIAFSSGLWDAREMSTSTQAEAFFRQNQNWPRSLMGNERVIESPDVFQRFVCQQMAVSLHPDCASVPPAMSAIPQGQPQLPTEQAMQSEDTRQNGVEIPPVPPSYMEER